MLSEGFPFHQFTSRRLLRISGLIHYLMNPPQLIPAKLHNHVNVYRRSCSINSLTWSMAATDFMVTGRRQLSSSFKLIRSPLKRLCYWNTSVQHTGNSPYRRFVFLNEWYILLFRPIKHDTWIRNIFFSFDTNSQVIRLFTYLSLKETTNMFNIFGRLKWTQACNVPDRLQSFSIHLLEHTTTIFLTYNLIFLYLNC